VYWLLMFVPGDMAFFKDTCWSWLSPCCGLKPAVTFGRSFALEPRCAAFQQRLQELNATDYEGFISLGPGEDIDHYFKILHILGEGAFGKVYSVAPTEKALAKMPVLQEQSYAFKRLPFPTKDDDLEMIQESYLHVSLARQKEFRNCLRSQDPEAKHLAKSMVELWQPCTSIYIVLEQLRGPDLLDWLHQQDYTVSERTCATLIRQSFSAIHYLHRYAGALHRDVKLDNFGFLEAYDGSPQKEPVLKLYDLGLCWVLPQPVTEETAHETLELPICGTPIYMAPEVWKDSNSAASDIWGLGVMSYALLSGCLPFNLDYIDCEDYRRVRAAVTRGSVDLYTKDWRGVSKEAKAFVSKLLLKVPKKRLTTTMALKDDWFQAASLSEHRSVAVKSRLPMKSRHITAMDLKGIECDEDAHTEMQSSSHSTMVPNSSAASLAVFSDGTSSFEPPSEPAWNIDPTQRPEPISV